MFNLEDVRDGVVEMLPLLSVEVLQLGSVLVLALIGHVRSRVKVVFSLKKKKKKTTQRQQNTF